MRPQLCAFAVLACTAALAGCTHDASTASSNEFITMEPVVAPAPERITRFADANRDGEVTRDEAKADPALAASFDRYDLDRNDKLDRGEFARLEDERAGRHAAVAAARAPASQRWLTEKPDGYFGPARTGPSLNRTGGEQSRPESSD